MPPSPANAHFLVRIQRFWLPDESLPKATLLKAGGVTARVKRAWYFLHLPLPQGKVTAGEKRDKCNVNYC